MTKRAWSDLSTSQQRAVLVVGALETVMTMAAWRDLATRPDTAVRGSKRFWALAVLVQPVGPIAYFTLGRR